MRLRPGHRIRRFVGSILPHRPDESDLDWVAQQLSPTELRVFERMSVRDRSHSIRVARLAASEVDRLDGDTAWMVPAALLHDAGKQVAGLGTYGRVVATLSGWLGGAGMGPVWAQRRGMTRRVGLYLQYPTLGADLLAVAGSDPRVVAWAREHHLDEDRWSVPLDAGRVLVAADDRA